MFDKASVGAGHLKTVEKKNLSLVVITLNEETSIERCLRSVPFADDIIVVDSGSTDGTADRARACGARVVQEAWRGFGGQKRFAVQQAKHDWVLCLDADEALSPESAAEIASRFATLDPRTGYQLPRRSFHLGRWILHGGWTPDFQLRLFHRGHSQWTEAPVHESVRSPARARLTQPILHWVFDDLSDQVITNDRYSGLQARERFARGERFSLFRLLVRPWGKFMETYFLKLGVLDGVPGFVISVSAAYSMFLRYAKIWELQRREGGR